MTYEEEKDKVLKTFRHEGGLEVSLKQYDGGEMKLQVGPRFIVDNKSSTEPIHRRAGRLSMDEVEWLQRKVIPQLDVWMKGGEDADKS